MPTTIVCPCGVMFTATPSQAAHGRRFCSRGCWREHGGRAGGATQHELYATWENIKARTSKHPRYAGRGIGLHEPWTDSARFIADVEDAIGPRPSGHTLDRIDNDQGYVPGNLRWATPADQQHNRGQRGTTRSGNGWSTGITREYRRIYIGYFPTEQEAHEAYTAARAAYREGGMTALLATASSYRR